MGPFIITCTMKQGFDDMFSNASTGFVKSQRSTGSIERGSGVWISVALWGEQALRCAAKPAFNLQIFMQFEH